MHNTFICKESPEFRMLNLAVKFGCQFIVVNDNKEMRNVSEFSPLNKLDSRFSFVLFINKRMGAIWSEFIIISQ